MLDIHVMHTWSMDVNSNGFNNSWAENQNDENSTLVFVFFALFFIYIYIWWLFATNHDEESFLPLPAKIGAIGNIQKFKPPPNKTKTRIFHGKPAKLRAIGKIQNFKPNISCTDTCVGSNHLLFYCYSQNHYFPYKKLGPLFYFKCFLREGTNGRSRQDFRRSEHSHFLKKLAQMKLLSSK